MRTTSMSRLGFTLIELVIVILLLGILATFAMPKLLGKGGFETQTLRDELLTRLRLVQTINMHEPAEWRHGSNTLPEQRSLDWLD